MTEHANLEFVDSKSTDINEYRNLNGMNIIDIDFERDDLIPEYDLDKKSWIQKFIEFLKGVRH